MNPLLRLATLGQSVYLDEIGRGMLRDGGLRRLIDEDGVHGVTSNPAIFEKAIAHTDHYDAAIAELARAGTPVEATYEALALDDIGTAADLFAEVHAREGGSAGYVSLEVSPHLADDTEGTVAEAHRLWSSLARPNVFIKVPGTRAGLAAIERLTADGVNVNVTLLFSLARYAEVADAYLRGLERRAAEGRPLTGIASVASFFLSRIDVAVDARLDALAASDDDVSTGEARRLRGRAAIASAKLAWVRYQQAFGGDRFAALAAAGAQPQWLLWASTGTKDPAYPATKYVEPLIGAPTITTLPRETLDAYRDEGDPALRLEDGIDEAGKDLARLADVGIDLDAVTHQLEREGVEKFAKPYDALLASLERALSQQA